MERVLRKRKSGASNGNERLMDTMTIGTSSHATTQFTERIWHGVQTSMASLRQITKVNLKQNGSQETEPHLNSKSEESE